MDEQLSASTGQTPAAGETPDPVQTQVIAAALELDHARSGLVCDECGRMPLRIHVAGPDGARKGSMCQWTSPHRCTGRLVRARATGGQQQ